MSGFVRSRGVPARRTIAFGLTLALLASCSHRAKVAIETPTPVAQAPRPELPAQYDAIVPPPRAADGSYLTINSGIDAEKTMWHLRAALNVAAIGCRRPEDAGLVPAYNALLKAQKTALAGADAAVKADFRKRLGAGWQNAHDMYMTQLYNFFAQPAAKANFCTQADAVAPQAAAIPPGRFVDFAQTALPQLESPFIATYRAVDEYRVALADWTAHRNGAPQTEIAVANPIPATAPSKAPRLRYAAMPMLLAWQPEEGTRIATR